MHVHAYRTPGYPRDFFGKRWATPDEIIQRYDELDIERGVLLPIVSPECRHNFQSNEDIIEFSQKWPDRFIPFCNIDPRQLTNTPEAPLQNILLYYQEEMGCKGVGEAMANLPFNNPMMENLLKHCEWVGLPFLFHIAPAIGGFYGIYDDPGLPLLEGALKKYPDLTFIGHSQPFWAEIAPLPNLEIRRGYPKGPVEKPGRVVELMRKYPNLHGDLSAGSGFNAVSRDKDFGIRFLEEFQDRLYFGTDLCDPNGKTPLVDYLIELREKKELNEKVFRKIARENIIKLLNL